MIVPQGIGERTEYNNYIGINLLSMSGKIYAGFIVMHKRIDEQEGF